MKKYQSFYRITIEAHSLRSGNSIVVVDDYYTPHIIGTGDDYKNFVKNSQECIKELNEDSLWKDAGGELTLKIDTCCFNNGKGRSLAAQTNVESYLVRDKNDALKQPLLKSIAEDTVIFEQLYEALKWLGAEQPPF